MIHAWLYKSIKGTVVNQTFPSFHGGRLEITLTVPLKKQASDFSMYEGSTDPYIVDSLNAIMEEEMDGLLGMN